MANNLNMQREYANQAAYTVAKTFDTSGMSLYSSVTNSVNDTANDIADQDIRDSIKTLDSYDTPWGQGGRYFVFHPTVWWHDIMGNSKYYKANEFGKGAPVATGGLGSSAKMGQLYGIPVVTTTQVQADGASSAYYNLLVHKSWAGYAIQTPPARTGVKRSMARNKVRVQYSYKHANLGDLWTNDIIYGVKLLRDYSAVVIKSRQTGIVS